VFREYIVKSINSREGFVIVSKFRREICRGKFSRGNLVGKFRVIYSSPRLSLCYV
jgi:hypothetical protein